MSTNNPEDLRNGRRGGGESKKPLVAQLDYGRINVTSTRLREGVTAMVVEDKSIFDSKQLTTFTFLMRVNDICALYCVSYRLK
jgi:hypothetical protein